MIIILLGPPGSGKGTQANLLAEKFDLYHLETSKVIEQKIMEANDSGSVVQILSQVDYRYPKTADRIHRMLSPISRWLTGFSERQKRLDVHLASWLWKTDISKTSIEEYNKEKEIDLIAEEQYFKMRVEE